MPVPLQNGGLHEFLHVFLSIQRFKHFRLSGKGEQVACLPPAIASQGVFQNAGDDLSGINPGKTERLRIRQNVFDNGRQIFLPDAQL